MKAALLAGVLLLPSPAGAQQANVTTIDFYGVRTVQQAALTAALGVRAGDPVTAIPSDLAARLRTVPGVRDAHVATVCCDSGGTILYVGIEEASIPPIEWRLAPSGPQRLPDAVYATGGALDDAIVEGVRKGVTGEDDTRGYALYDYPLARSIQNNMATWVAANTQLVRNVLNNSRDEDHRALAAQIIAYAPDRAMVIRELSSAMRDPSPAVRNNAMRALAVLAMYPGAHPEEKLEVPVAGFVELLTSLVWTDRNKASFALMSLTERRDPVLMTQLRVRALDALIDMAQWKSFGHAMPALLILGRIGGMTDDQIMRAVQVDRPAIIAAARRAGR